MWRDVSGVCWVILRDDSGDVCQTCGVSIFSQVSLRYLWLLILIWTWWKSWMWSYQIQSSELCVLWLVHREFWSDRVTVLWVWGLSSKRSFSDSKDSSSSCLKHLSRLHLPASLSSQRFFHWGKVSIPRQRSRTWYLQPRLSSSVSPAKPSEIPLPGGRQNAGMSLHLWMETVLHLHGLLALLNKRAYSTKNHCALTTIKTALVVKELNLFISNSVFTTVKGRCLLASCFNLNWIICGLRFRAVGIRSDPVPAGRAPTERRGLIFCFHSSHEVKPCQDCGKRARLAWVKPTHPVKSRWWWWDCVRRLWGWIWRAVSGWRWSAEVSIHVLWNGELF